MNKKVLVTGATGLLGRNLIPKLYHKGYIIRATYNKTTHSNHLVAEQCYGDLTNKQFCNEIIEGIDYVIHCAASTSGAAVMDKTPLTHVTPNVVMNSYLLEAAFKNKVKKFLWFASTTGYPELTFPAVELDMFHGDPYEKYFAVGWTKRFTEKLCQLYNKLGMPCIVLRPSNIYGPHDKFDPQRSHVLPSLIRKLVEKVNPFEVWGDGTEERDLIYVDDMVQATILALEKMQGYDPINIGAGHTVSINDMIKIIMSLEGFYPEIKYIEGPRMIPKREVDVSKAEKLLGFKAAVPLELGIKHTIEWYKNEFINNNSINQT